MGFTGMKPFFLFFDTLENRDIIIGLGVCVGGRVRAIFSHKQREFEQHI